ncbi:MAG: hypothetical protein LBF78_07925 [Treponema sp.]|jgi:hypothetical protein|nr:hypothetical protein [Treponema sp.]
MKRTTVLFKTAVFGIAALLVLTLSGCPNPNNGSVDTWEKVTGLDELAGTAWEGAVNVPIPAQEEFPATSISGTISITVTEDKFTEKIDMDMDKFLTDYCKSMGGGDALTTAVLKEMMWGSIKNPSETPDVPADPEAEYTINYEFTDNYHVKMNFEAPIPEDGLLFTGETALYAPYVNQDKTKLKIVLPEELPEELDGYAKYLGGKEEFILYRQ